MADDRSGVLQTGVVMVCTCRQALGQGLRFGNLDDSRPHHYALCSLTLSTAAVSLKGYYVAQNNLAEYLREPWRILAIWEGGLAFFGGLFGGILAAWLYIRRAGLEFARVADLFAPAIPIGAAIGRMPCGLDGMDYGTPTSLPWGVVYGNPASYAPNDGIPRHPDQFYELVGDFLIAAVLIRLRPRLPPGATFLLYLVLFGAFRFVLFFVRGNVAGVALGLKNAQWTALAIVAVAMPLLMMRLRHVHRTRAAA